MKYLIVRIIEVESDSIVSAVESALELEAHSPVFAMEANAVNTAACQAAVVGSQEILIHQGKLMGYGQ